MKTSLGQRHGHSHCWGHGQAHQARRTPWGRRGIGPAAPRRTPPADDEVQGDAALQSVVGPEVMSRVESLGEGSRKVPWLLLAPRKRMPHIVKGGG